MVLEGLGEDARRLSRFRRAEAVTNLFHNSNVQSLQYLQRTLEISPSARVTGQVRC